MRWNQVLADWQESEEEVWQPVYKERGFGSWLEWRESYIYGLKLDERTWEENVVTEPHLVVPTYCIGGYRGWQKYRPADQDIATFEDIATMHVPGEIAYDGSLREDVAVNPKVHPLVGNLRNTTILTLRCGHFVVVLDGTHRCAAIAVENTVAVLSLPFKLTVHQAAFRADEMSMLQDFCRDRPMLVKK